MEKLDRFYTKNFTYLLKIYYYQRGIPLLIIGLLTLLFLAAVNFYLVPKSIVDVKYQFPLSIVIIIPIGILLFFDALRIFYVTVLVSGGIWLRDSFKEEQEKAKIYSPWLSGMLIFLIVFIYISVAIGVFVFLTRFI